MSLLDPASVPPLAERYPRAPGRLRHRLAAELLFGKARLIEAARALPPSHVEQWVHDPQPGAAARQRADGEDPACAIAAGGASRRSVLLRHIEDLSPYRALLQRLMGELAAVIVPATGPARDIKGEIYISAPGDHTPFHFDAEYTILLQISGDRMLAAYPPAPPYLDLARREAYHRAGENRLEWQSGFAAAGDQHLLAPGDALFVPYAAPHWVHAGDGASIALSVSWQCRRSRAEADALALNPLLRRVGLTPYDPAATTAAPWLRAAASRVGQRIGLI
jgi:hypothetical protein